MENAAHLIEQLNLLDENCRMEVKRGLAIDRSILETVCSFSNEPELGGGYILLGIEEGDRSTGLSYKVTGVRDPDQLQADVASQCATVFNQPVRPLVRTEYVEGKAVLNIFVPELPPAQNPCSF